MRKFITIAFRHFSVVVTNLKIIVFKTTYKTCRAGYFTVAGIFNSPKHIANHIFGQQHSPGHRISVGLVVAFVGILFADLPEFHSHFARLSFTMVGVTIHAIGVNPIIEHLTREK